MNKIMALFKVRNLEFMRDNGALLWNIVMPVLLIFALWLSFAQPNHALFKVVALPNSEDLSDPFRKSLSHDYIKLYAGIPEAKALLLLQEHQYDMILEERSGTIHYWLNEGSKKGPVLETLLKHNWLEAQLPYEKETVTGNAIRYVDWVLPGILAINMMYSCLYGVGFVIVRYRKNGYLRRLQTTPITAFDFLSAQILSRLLITQCANIIVFSGAYLLLKLKVVGSIIALLSLSLAGAISFISLGLLISARITSEELSRGVLELCAWPMLLLGGAFFNLESAVPILRVVATCLPITYLVSGVREVMLYGASFSNILPNLLILLGFSTIFLSLGVRYFSWQNTSY